MFFRYDFKPTFQFPALFLIIISASSAPKPPFKHSNNFIQLLLAKSSEIPRLKLSLFFNQIKNGGKVQHRREKKHSQA